MNEPHTGPVETILKVLAEGESMTLQGQRAARGAWRFRVIMDSGMLWEMIDEEPPPPQEVFWVDSWDAALGQMDRYSWPRLHPGGVHPEFVGAVLKAVAAHRDGVPNKSHAGVI